MLLATALALTLSADPAATSNEWSAGFDRVDLISEEIGTFLNYDVLEVTLYPLKPTMRFVEQVKVSFRLPWSGFYAGASIASQSLTYEWAVGPKGLFLTGGVVTRLLFPRGVIAGAAYRVGNFRFGFSLSAFSSGSWSAPGSFQWTALPSLGVGIGL
jgi:hypothetical protein